MKKLILSLCMILSIVIFDRSISKIYGNDKDGKEIITSYTEPVTINKKDYYLKDNETYKIITFKNEDSKTKTTISFSYDNEKSIFYLSTLRDAAFDILSKNRIEIDKLEHIEKIKFYRANYKSQEIIDITSDYKENVKEFSFEIPYSKGKKYAQITKISGSIGGKSLNHILYNNRVEEIDTDQFAIYGELWYRFKSDGKIDRIRVGEVASMQICEYNKKSKLWDIIQLGGKRTMIITDSKESAETYFETLREKGIGWFLGEKAEKYIRDRNYVITMTEEIKGQKIKTLEMKFNKEYKITEIFVRKIDYRTNVVGGSITFKIENGKVISETRSK